MVTITLESEKCNCELAGILSLIISQILEDYHYLSEYDVQNLAQEKFQKIYDDIICHTDFNKLLPHPEGISSDWIRYGHYNKVVHCDDYTITVRIQRVLQKSEKCTHSVFISPLLPFVSVTVGTILDIIRSKSHKPEISDYLFRSFRKHFPEYRKISLKKFKDSADCYCSLIRKMVNDASPRRIFQVFMAKTTWVSNLLSEYLLKFKSVEGDERKK